MGVVEAEGGVEPDGDPDPVPQPGHLTDLALLPREGVQRALHTHEPRVQDVDPVPVAQPDLAVDLHHGPDGVVGPAEVQQVVVTQVPLTLLVPVEYGHGPVCQGGQHSSLDMPGEE